MIEPGSLTRTIVIADLFCGAGGTSTGALQAAEAAGYRVDLTAVNHWPVAVKTHSANHPEARHLCASVDSLNPLDAVPSGKLDILWASPECTHHSRARGGKPMQDQSRASAWCVTRWAEALSPSVIFVENVPEFAEWGPLGSNGKPMVSRKGETFSAWLNALRSLGYRVDHRILCAADYGDPTTRSRLFVQAVRGRRRIAWPEPTHRKNQDLFPSQAWRSAAEAVIDWTIPTPTIASRKRPLAPKTMERINEGLRKYHGAPFVVLFRGTSPSQVNGSARLVSEPLSTVSAGGIHHGLAYLLPQQSDGRLRPATEPAPTVSTAGAIALIIEYYGTGQARPVTEPLSAVTCRDRFGLATLTSDQIGFRMLQPHELAAAQGFPRGYQFAGTKTDAIRQIGNAVPCGLSRALVGEFLVGEK